MKFECLFLVLIMIFLSGCVQQETPELEDSGIWKPDGVVKENEYAGNMILYGPESRGYSGGDLEVFWKTDDENLYMALKGKTSGWIAIGFDPIEWMTGADIVMGSVDGKATVVEDQYSIDNYGPHSSDEMLGGTNDVLEFGGSEKDGYTVIEFKRKLDTGDEFDRVLTPGQGISIIWGMADSNNLQSSHNVARAEGYLDLGANASEAREVMASLTASEQEGILFIREEEIMAKDLYLELYKETKLPIFWNVAGSEQIHMDSVKILMDKYGLEDPVQDGNGKYANQDIQKMYDDLLEEGAKSPVDALKAGAVVEEMSVHDLQTQIANTDKPDFHSVYGGLLVGSEKHLRSYIRALKERGAEYSPQYLSEEEFDKVLNM